MTTELLTASEIDGVPEHKGVTPVRRSGRLRRHRLRRGAARWVVVVLMVIFCAVVVSPIALVILNAFKTQIDFSNNGFLALPQAWDFGALIQYWNQSAFPIKLLNSTVIAASVAVLAVIVSLLNAYAIGIGRVRGRLWLILLFLLANLLPAEAMIYPLYYASKSVGLYNTQLAVIIIFTAIHSAFGTYLLASVFSTFPKSLLEAAALDGASRWTILWRVVFPIARPTMLVLFTLFFVWTWNEFYIPLVMLVDDDVQTVPLALISLRGQYLSNIPLLNAGALLSLLPTVLFFFLFQRSLTRGITVGAVK